VNREALDLWQRAVEALRTSGVLLEVSPDAAASRAHYAAFYAVSALFAAEGITFKRHSAVEAAVHRDLVRSGRWDAELGASYTKLFGLRQTGDYGGGKHVTVEDARQGLEAATAIVAAVSRGQPEQFTLAEDAE
jgi:uncharacterized protein (UPF0332 family)